MTRTFWEPFELGVTGSPLQGLTHSLWKLSRAATTSLPSSQNLGFLTKSCCSGHADSIHLPGKKTGPEQILQCHEPNPPCAPAAKSWRTTQVLSPLKQIFEAGWGHRSQISISGPESPTSHKLLSPQKVRLAPWQSSDLQSLV